MTVRFDLTQHSRYTIDRFRGLNKDSNSFRIRDGQLQEVKNMEFTKDGALRVRLGTTRYDTAGTHYGTGDNPKGIHRYSKSDGMRELIFNQGNTVYRDNDTTTIATLGTMSAGADGFIRFCQWGDVLYATSENDETYTFSKGASTEWVETTNTGRTNLAGNPFNFAQVTADSGFDGGNYIYLFTYDRFHGDIFIGESFPLNNGLSTARDTVVEGYMTGITNPLVQSVQATVNATESVEIRKGAIDPFAADDTIRRINIYRSGDVSPDTSFNTYKIPTVTTTNSPIVFEYIGSIEKDRWDAAALNDALFLDDRQTTDAGRTLTSTLFFNSDIPQSRFCVVHKNRLWRLDITVRDYTNIQYATTGTSKYVNTFDVADVRCRSDVLFSEYLSPNSIRKTSRFTVGLGDGEGITGAFSWKNRALVILKTNSTHAVFGGDVESIPGVPNFELEIIEEAVGCVAPGSIAQGEDGAIWLSNRGFEFFDGTRVRPISTQGIEADIKMITDNRKPLAYGEYWEKERKYVCAVSLEDQNSSANTVLFEFDFFTGLWTKHVVGNTTVYGVNSMVEYKKSDEAGQFLISLDNNASGVGNIHKFKQGATEIDGSDGILYEAELGHTDCGDPDRIKRFKGAMVQVKSADVQTFTYDVDDGCSATTTTIPVETCGSGTSHVWDEADLNWQGSPVEDSTHIWGSGGSGAQRTYLIIFPQEIEGKRISGKISGTATAVNTEWQRVTWFFKREQRIASS